MSNSPVEDGGPIPEEEPKKVNGHLETPLTKAVRDVVNEYKRAVDIYKPFNSYHEGISILLEEYEELWNEVKKKSSAPPTDKPYDPDDYQDPVKMREEAIQVAAMALRYIVDLT